MREVAPFASAGGATCVTIPLVMRSLEDGTSEIAPIKLAGPQTVVLNGGGGSPVQSETGAT